MGWHGAYSSSKSAFVRTEDACSRPVRSGGWKSRRAGGQACARAHVWQNAGLCRKARITHLWFFASQPLQQWFSCLRVPLGTYEILVPKSAQVGPPQLEHRSASQQKPRAEKFAPLPLYTPWGGHGPRSPRFARKSGCNPSPTRSTPATSRVTSASSRSARAVRPSPRSACATRAGALAGASASAGAPSASADASIAAAAAHARSIPASYPPHHTAPHSTNPPLPSPHPPSSATGPGPPIRALARPCARCVLCGVHPHPGALKTPLMQRNSNNPAPANQTSRAWRCAASAQRRASCAAAPRWVASRAA